MAIMDEKATQNELESTSQLSNNDLEQPGVDLAAEQKVIQKIDRHIIPVVMLLYLLVSRLMAPTNSPTSKIMCR